MRFKIVSVGRERSDPFAAIVADYRSRIAKQFPIDDVVLKSGPDDRVTERLLKATEGADLVVALDERGRSYDSPRFARELGQWMNRGVGRVTFVIGPAEGLPEAVKARAGLMLSLSRMTLPHRLARLIVVEQLYRGISILRGTPYQK